MTTPAAGTSAPQVLLDPVLLARIADLPLLARTVVDGFMHGLHRSARKGFSLDFAEHRSYQPGDDLRRIDWKAYARTDRFYVKEYEADTNAGVLFALDVSGSMDFAGSDGSVNKFTYARMLVASLTWLSQRHGDRVGLATFSDRLVEMIPPSTRHLNLILQALGRAQPRGEGKLPLAIDRVADVANRPGIVVIVTDCYDEPASIGRSVDTIRARGHDVLVFHLIDRAEEEFPYEAAGVFEDGESGFRVPLKPDEMRARYLKLFGAHRDALVKRFAASGVDYVPLRTDQPLDGALHAYLDRRLAQGRVR